MSDYYGVVFSAFWTGPTGQQIRQHGKDAQILAIYLMSCRHATMLGLYHLPYRDIRHETGLGLKGIARAFDALEQCAFADYDIRSQYVWVREMAKFRLGLQRAALKKGDHRIQHLRKRYAELDDNPFLGAFYDRYHKDLHLTGRRKPLASAVKGLRRGFGGAPKPVTDNSNSNSNSTQRTEDQDQNKPALIAPGLSHCGNPVENPKTVMA